MLKIHVILSLIAILFGLLALYGLLSARLSRGWTAIFLATTILTSLTGFPLAPFGFDPPRAVGVISLVLLVVAVAAYYAFHLTGAWRWIFVRSAVAALYLNVFVLIVQSFTKLPFLTALAPTQSEPPVRGDPGRGAVGFRRARRMGRPQLPPADCGADVEPRRGAAGRRGSTETG